MSQGRQKAMRRAGEAAAKVEIPVIDVRLSDEQKRQIREDALRVSRSMGVSDEEWERYRAKASEPFRRDLGMLIDPVRKIEIMRKADDQ